MQSFIAVLKERAKSAGGKGGSTDERAEFITGRDRVCKNYFISPHLLLVLDILLFSNLFCFDFFSLAFSSFPATASYSIGGAWRHYWSRSVL
jgi:hypothetical protein